MILSLTLIVTTVTIFLFHLYFKQKRVLESVKHIPGPEPLPIIGNALEIKDPQAILPVMLRNKHKYGEIYKMLIGDDIRIVVSGHKFAEFFLSSNNFTTKPNTYKYFESWLGQGIFVANGDRWKNIRKILTPAFHFKILDTFIEDFEKCGNVLVQQLKKEIGKPNTDIKDMIFLCALDIIHETAMGTGDFNAQLDRNSEYLNSIKDMCNIVMERIFNFFQHSNFLYKFSKNYRKEKKALKIINDHTKAVIIQKREEIRARKRKDSERETREFGIKKKKAFLDLLLQYKINGKPFTDWEIQQEVNNFMFGGHDTTATTIVFLLYNLSKYLDVQNKIVDELRGIFGSDKYRNATSDDLQQMKYLEMAIKESLRLHTTAPFFGRYLDRDVVVCGYKLPKGSFVNIFAQGIHLDPKYYPDPEKYDPERFSPENAASIPNFAFIPFAAGSRNCAGQKFAMLEMKSLMSKLLRYFEFLPTNPEHKPDLSVEIVLTSKNGMRLIVNERKF